MTQEKALEILKQGYNVYLTGPAGSGKTYLLNQFIDHCHEQGKEVAVTASTGIAATHMKGMTIHSWCGLGIKNKLTERDITKLKKDAKLRRRLVKTDVLIIDEVSMLHDYQLDIINRICRLFKDPFLPMGGIQVILCGDFFQLPPVAKGLDKAKFVVHSHTWQELELKVCYLHEIHRQKDDALAQVLQAIRERAVGDEERQILATREDKLVRGCKNPTKLFTHNKDADELNQLELEKLDTPAREYQMYCEGDDYIIGALKKDCLAPERLVLKPGAAVMFVKNNFEEGYVNGTIGEVVGFHHDGMPIVRTRDGQRIVVTPQAWVMDDDRRQGSEPVAYIKQLPLRLAWAITVHKSQGTTLDAVEIDLAKAFAYGMGYVALSRARSLDGITLRGINETALKVDPFAHQLDLLLKELSKFAEKELQQSEREPEAEEFEYVSEDELVMEEAAYYSEDRTIDLDTWSPADEQRARELLKQLKAQTAELNIFQRGIQALLSRFIKE